MGWHVGMVGLQEQYANRGGKGGGELSSDEEDVYDLSPTKALEYGVSTSAAPGGGNNNSGTHPQASSEWENLPKPQPPPKYHQNVYHLCRKTDWEGACNSKIPYFPRTFLKHGKYTRASMHLDDVAHVANQYYWKTSPTVEEWIVLEIDVQFLFHGLGIPMEVAIAPESPKHLPIECLQIFGGISTHPKIVGSLVKSVYKMKRRDVDGKFVGMLYSILLEKGKENESENETKKSAVAPKRKSSPVKKLSINTTEEYPVIDEILESTSDESNEMKVIDKAIDNIDKAIDRVSANYDTAPKKKKKFKKLLSKFRGRKSWSP